MIAPDEIQAVLEGIDDASTVAQLVGILRRLLPALDVRHAAYCGVPPLDDGDTRKWIVVVTYPDRWVRHYRDRDYFRSDPIIRATMGGFAPIDWKQLGQLDNAARGILTEAAEYGIGEQGLAFPIRGASGEFAVFTVTSDCDEIAWARLKTRRMSDWMRLGYYIHRRVLDIHAKDLFGRVTKLSPRETECLRLTAQGHTSEDVALAMSISERVVRAHLQNCRYKLNALNTTHAVARAVRLGLIRQV